MKMDDLRIDLLYKRREPERQRGGESLPFAEHEDLSARSFDLVDEASAGSECDDGVIEQRAVAAAKKRVYNMLGPAVIKGVYYVCDLVTHPA